jgi:uncharacterized protein with ParB-like and HNH nuclease domain
MPFQMPVSISDAISRIDFHRLLLPAIQREFVWGPEKIEWLFDSILQGYPIGSFLFWEVRTGSDRNKFRYYEFLREFREWYRTHNPEFNTDGFGDFYAVLDGQQRLTAIYIGLKGSYAYKKPRVWWEDSERVLPTRKLYLNINAKAPEDEEQPGRKYEFKLLTIDEYAKEPKKWFQVGKILDVVTAAALNKMFATMDYQNNEFAINALSELHAAIHTHKLINYYTVENAGVDEALNVFVRVNSGGEPLTLSDVLMSTLIANWHRDARKEVVGLIDQVHTRGFFISKDLVLKACLYLYSSDIRYKISNFSAQQAALIEESWDAVRESILCIFDMVQDFGYNETSLISKNALLPIIFWIHHKGLAQQARSSPQFRDERRSIRQWLHLVLLKGIFGGSADTILAAIRRAITGDGWQAPFISPDLARFPVEGIARVLREQGKEPQVTDEFIESLLRTQYEEKSCFTILAILRPDLDYKNVFHKDHLHPASCFRRRTALEKAGVRSEDIDFYSDTENWNSILNLSHLDASENQSKSHTPLVEWVRAEAKRRKVTVSALCSDLYLPGEEARLEFGIP